MIYCSSHSGAVANWLTFLPVLQSELGADQWGANSSCAVVPNWKTRQAVGNHHTSKNESHNPFSYGRWCCQRRRSPSGRSLVPQGNTGRCSWSAAWPPRAELHQRAAVSCFLPRENAPVWTPDWGRGDKINTTLQILLNPASRYRLILEEANAVLLENN